MARCMDGIGASSIVGQVSAAKVIWDPHNATNGIEEVLIPIEDPIGNL